MGRRKRASVAAAKRSAAQTRNPLTFKFVSESRISDSDVDFELTEHELSDQYSTDSSEEAINSSEDETLLSKRTYILREQSERVFKKRKAPYLGTSERTKQRKWGPNGVYTLASKNTKSLTEYFPNVNKNDLPNESSNTDMDNNTCNTIVDDNIVAEHMRPKNITIENNPNFIRRLEELDNILSGNTTHMTAFDFLQKTAVSRYLHLAQQPDAQHVDSSQIVAADVYNKGAYKATVIRYWARHWIENGQFPLSRQGCHQKTKAIIDDEDVISSSMAFIRSKEHKISSKEYREFVNTTLFAEIGLKKQITMKTARIWLRKLGLVPTARKKGKLLFSLLIYKHAKMCFHSNKGYTLMDMSVMTLSNIASNFLTKCKLWKHSCLLTRVRI